MSSPKPSVEALEAQFADVCRGVRGAAERLTKRTSSSPSLPAVRPSKMPPAPDTRGAASPPERR